MQHSHRYQHFAIDVDNNIINIKNADEANGQRYFCPYCHKEMITKRGHIRQWHFAHKTDKCSYDKYLHSIAEILIMNWFNKQKSIILDMYNYEKCNEYKSCVFYNKEKCKGRKRVQFDLKKYYSKCTTEHKYNGFIADLYCERDNNTNSPLFIEIFVTHECSHEKKNSGIRIIELTIQSEEDILNIVNSSKLIENGMVRLYNF
uniref:competence protein CoiA family protein n=1 Tax=Bacteroides acidifaciens TaxID=85831 RepID=UPI002597355A